MDWILVPLDFSSCAPLLLAEAMRFARAFGTGLILLHAAESPQGLPLPARIHPPGADASMTVAEWLRAEAEAYLARIRVSVEEAGVPVQTRVALGRPAEAILAAADQASVRLIVMGTHGRTGLAHAVLGSVAEQVLRGAVVPVVTVRTQHKPTCAARSCQTCEEQRSPGEQALVAEVEG